MAEIEDNSAFVDLSPHSSTEVVPVSSSNDSSVSDM